MARVYVADRIFEHEKPKSDPMEQTEPLEARYENRLGLDRHASSHSNRVAAGRGVDWGADKRSLFSSERSPLSSLNETFDRSTTARSCWLSPCTWEVQIVKQCPRAKARRSSTRAREVLVVTTRTTSTSLARVDNLHGRFRGSLTPLVALQGLH